METDEPESKRTRATAETEGQRQRQTQTDRQTQTEIDKERQRERKEARPLSTKTHEYWVGGAPPRTSKLGGGELLAAAPCRSRRACLPPVVGIVAPLASTATANGAPSGASADDDDDALLSVTP